MGLASLSFRGMLVLTTHQLHGGKSEFFYSKKSTTIKKKDSGE